jgi:hypothetical protein
VDKYYPSFIFHNPKFIYRDPESDVIRFNHESAEIFFSNQEQTLMSLNASPFGSFLTDREIAKIDVQICLDKLYGWSASNGITQLVIRSFPDEYHPKYAHLIKETLLESSFQVLYTDVAQVIFVSASGSMDVNIHKRRRLRNAESRRFQFRSLIPSFLGRSYELFLLSRNNKGYPITMSLEGLQNMFSLFPDEYLLFGVFDEEKMIAASVSIKICPEILYCFYIGDDLKYRSQSPVTALIAGIYEYCRANNFSLLDLGLSSDKGTVNKGLYTFKKSFGAVESPKFTFAKQL